MLLIIKPILFAFLKSDSVKQLVVDLLEAYVKRTDNKLDDIIQIVSYDTASK